MCVGKETADEESDEKGVKRKSGSFSSSLGGFSSSFINKLLINWIKYYEKMEQTARKY